MTYSLVGLRWSLALLTVLACASCSGRTALDDPQGDRDGDGWVNEEDCAPDDPHVVTDGDGDGYQAEACWIGEPYFNLSGESDDFADCDDDDPEVHPAGPGRTGDPEYDEEIRVEPEQPRDESSLEICSEVPEWAYDGIDNDCDGDTDVPDYDGDTVDSEEWARSRDISFAPGEYDCDDCRKLVNPTIDEWQVDAASGCPVYAYDGIDNDCDGEDVTDFDGDGYDGGWHHESACGQQVNETLREGAPTGEPTPTNADLIDLAALSDPELDCWDIDDPEYEENQKNPGVQERCDNQDWNCSFPRDGDWETRFDSEYTYDGFTAIPAGAYGHDSELPSYYIYVDDDGTDKDMGATPDTPLPAIGKVARYIQSCPVIYLRPGSYQESVDLQLMVDTDTEDTGDLDAPVALPARQVAFIADPGTVTWDGVYGPALSITQPEEGDLLLQGITFVGGDDADASYEGSCAVVYSGTIEVRDAVFSDCYSARAGGGLFAATSESVTIEDVAFQGCESGGSGGGAYIQADVLATVSGVDASLNRAGDDGGGLYVAGTTVSVEDVALEDNVADRDGGGALVAATGTARLTRVAVGNTTPPVDGYNAGGDGGGVLVDANVVDVDTFTSSGAIAQGAGGALFVNSRGSTDLDNLDIDCNPEEDDPASVASATEGGGAWLLVPGATVSDLNVRKCRSSGDGGGVSIFSSGDVTFDESDDEGAVFDLSTNVAAGNGGGLYLFVDGTVSVLDTLTLTGNEAEGDGGGLWAHTQGMDIGDLVASFNDAVDGGGAYLSIAEGHSASLRSATVSENLAVGSGGGMFLTGGGEVSIDGGVFADNVSEDSEDSDGGGGAIYASALDLFELMNSTISGDGTSASASGKGGGVAISVVETAVINNACFTALAATGAGGAINIHTVGNLYLGTSEDGDGEGLSVSESFSASVGGGLALTLVENAVIEGLQLNNNSTKEDEDKGNHLYLDQVKGTINELTATNGGAGVHPVVCPVSCAGETAIFQTYGDLELTNSRVHDNAMAGWAIVLSQTARLDARNVLISNNGEAGGIWVKNNATLLMRSATIMTNTGDDDSRYRAIRGGRAVNIVLGCTVLKDNYRGLFQYRDGERPGLFCVVSRDNGSDDVSHNIDCGGCPETDTGESGADGVNEYICVETPGEGDLDLEFGTAGGWPYVSSVPSDCGSCLHTYGSAGAPVTSEMMYPAETYTSEDDTVETAAVTFTCGGGGPPLGYDARYDGRVIR